MVEATDSLVQTLDHPIRLPVFEGPLDLLLFLIRKNEIEIYDIPIETVTRQYLEILYQMKEMDLDVAGEFFVMAATLMVIKSRMLLPKDEQLPQAEGEEESDLDPRWELVRQLVEYKKFKEAAAQLRELVTNTQDLLPRRYAPTEDPVQARPLRPTDRIELWNTFNQVLRRLAEKITVGQIHAETVTVSDRMEFLLRHLQEQPSFTFSSLFEGRSYSLVLLVATFLAVLELTRLRHLNLSQTADFGDILCESAPPEPPPSTLPLNADAELPAEPAAAEVPDLESDEEPPVSTEPDSPIPE